MDSPRRILGNLDCEAELAREDARLRRERGEKAPSPRDPRFALPREIEGSVSAFATLLRAFSRDGDRLWTARPVEEHRVAEVPGIPRPALESGSLEGAAPCASVLAWAETPAVERLRVAASPEDPESTNDATTTATLAGLVWMLPPPCGSAVLRVNHRAFCLETAERLGCALPGARRLGSARELESHLASGGAAASRGERWVVKAPLSAAGRARVRGAGRSISAGVLRQAERLLELYGELLFEPWMERTEDFGCCALLGESELRVLPPHRLEVDPRGGFRGIGLLVGESSVTFMIENEPSVLRKTVEGVAERLRAAGYTGPFGIDCWRYRDLTGALRFHPLGEINARMSFGLVARAIVERLVDAGVLESGTEVRLRLGKGDELTRRESAGARVIPLLFPSPLNPEAAWLDVAATPAAPG